MLVKWTQVTSLFSQPRIRYSLVKSSIYCSTRDITITNWTNKHKIQIINTPIRHTHTPCIKSTAISTRRDSNAKMFPFDLSTKKKSNIYSFSWNEFGTIRVNYRTEPTCVQMQEGLKRDIKAHGFTNEYKPLNICTLRWCMRNVPADCKTPFVNTICPNNISTRGMLPPGKWSQAIMEGIDFPRCVS